MSLSVSPGLVFQGSKANSFTPTIMPMAAHLVNQISEKSKDTITLGNYGQTHNYGQLNTTRQHAQLHRQTPDHSG